MKFLTGVDVEPAIKVLISESRSVRVAVAYWGADAVKRLGLSADESRDFRILCDIRSGGCNPNEIRRLQAAVGADKIKRCDRLHAKVWLAEDAALVGSSNASSNGLGYEGDETKGFIEANLLIDDADILLSIKSWFDSLYCSASIVDKEDLVIAERRWKPHRLARSTPMGASLLDLLQHRPEELMDRNIFIWIYKHQDNEKWAERTREKEAEKRRDPDIDFWQVEKMEASTPPGSYVIDFNADNNRMEFDGSYQVLLDRPLVEKTQGTILLCRSASRVCGLPLKRVERRMWIQAATKAVQEEPDREIWPIEDFARHLPSEAA